MIGKKLVWLMVLMIWVGMVSSIIIYQGDVQIPFASVTSRKTEVVDKQEVTDEKKGEDINYAELKENKNVDNGKNFFIEYRIERDKARSEQINIYREMINNPNTDKSAKEEAQDKMLALTDKIEEEIEIESLIRARGFKDALAYIHDNSVDVIIQTAKHLNKDEVARVGDIIVKTTGFDFDDVTIIEKKGAQK